MLPLFIQYQARKRSIIFGIAFLLFTCPAQADPQEELVQKAQQLKLAQHPTWRKLLHYEDKAKESVVLTEAFFLSPQGKVDPQAELTATINAYFTPWGEKPDDQARCRFPARYYWLSKYLDLPDYQYRDDHCGRLEKWALFDSVKSVSVLLVSGYLGNPASTFGHAFLKFNTDSSDDKTGLFDLTLNYGAMVPEKEVVLLYVARGIFGGYKAGFSDKYFYTQDLVYSRTEFRDIWDYKLKLTDDQRRLLMLHVWEIIGNKFDYYFLDKNCAYRLAELLQLVVEEDLVHTGKPWYLPVELFYRLKAISAVTFVPSSQRILYHQLSLLSLNELKVFNAILKEGPSSLARHLAILGEERRLVVLDALLAYQQYRLIAQEPNPSKLREEFKDQILLARLQLPAHERLSVKVKELPSPAKGARPMSFGVSVASRYQENPYLRLNWSPFKQEIVGNNNLEGDELVVADLGVGFWEEEHKAFIDQFDLVRILNINTLPVSIADESRLSWGLRIGSNRVDDRGKDRYDGVASFGVGRALQFNDQVLGYLMVDMAGHSIAPYGRLRPHVALRFDWGGTKSWIYGGAESQDYRGDFHEIWGGKLQYQLDDQYALYLDIANEKATRFSLGLNWNW